MNIQLHARSLRSCRTLPVLAALAAAPCLAHWIEQRELPEWARRGRILWCLHYARADRRIVDEFLAFRYKAGLAVTHGRPTAMLMCLPPNIAAPAATASGTRGCTICNRHSRLATERASSRPARSHSQFAAPPALSTAYGYCLVRWCGPEPDPLTAGDGAPAETAKPSAVPAMERTGTAQTLRSGCNQGWCGHDAEVYSDADCVRERCCAT